LLGGVTILVIVVGVFSSIAASSISKSNAYTGNGQSKDSHAVAAYHDCIIAAVASLGSFLLTLLILGVYYYSSSNVTPPVYPPGYPQTYHSYPSAYPQRYPSYPSAYPQRYPSVYPAGYSPSRYTSPVARYPQSRYPSYGRLPRA
jgi:hypothetical protein